MASPASADRRARAAFVAAVLGATALGWLALSSLSAGYAAPLCGLSVEGLTSLAGLIAMWGLMVATMMLPVTLPLVTGRSTREDAGFALGYLAMALVPALGAALAEWTLRAVGAMPGTLPSSLVAGGLVGIAALGIVRDARIRQLVTVTGFHRGLATGHAHLGGCTAMVALQLALGSMDILLMAALALWMLAAAMTPGRVPHAT